MEHGGRGAEAGTGGGLRAGFGRRDITPSKPCFVVGYPHADRISTGVHDPLFASAVCLEYGGSAVLLISLDVLFVSAEWTRDSREVISRRTGIPGEAILFGATHTHSGPHTAEVMAWREDPVVPPVDPTLLAFMREQALAAAVDAWTSREPAEAAWCRADVRGLAGGNRIDPEGAEDPEAGLLLIRREKDAGPLCVVSVYGMHPTVLHEDSTLFSSDFIAFARRTVEDAMDGAGLVYLNGVCGDQSPRRVVKAQTFAEAERIGRALGERFVAALKEAAPFARDFPIAHAVHSLHVEGKCFPAVEEAEARLTQTRRRFDQLRTEGAPTSTLRTAECTVFGAEEVLTLAKAERSGEAASLRESYGRVEIQALRLGDSFVAAWPGEFFVEYGLDLKRRARARVFVATICNGELQGYVVTPAAEAVGGYEAQMSLLPASAGAAVVEGTLALLREMP